MRQVYIRRLTRSAILTAFGLAVAGAGTVASSAASDQSDQSDQNEAQPEKILEALEFQERPDIEDLPRALRRRLTTLARRPNTYTPMRVFAEAQKPSRLFQYYLLDTRGFQRNVFTTQIVGINDGAVPTATGPNGDLPTIGAVRVVLEPKPGLPTDPHNPRAFIDIFTDISGLFVINNESGWYEGWMIHDVTVPGIAPPRVDGSGAQFGTVTPADAVVLAAQGSGNNRPGATFTLDGKAPRLPNGNDVFPGKQSNLLPLQLSMGAYNCTQQSDCHSYWEFNEYTDWTPPPYELPFTGGLPGSFEAGQVGARSSVVPGSGPSGITNDPRTQGDDPNNPRDPDRGPNVTPTDIDRPAVNNDDHKEKRLRFIPSGLANEILLDAYLRRASFEPGVVDPARRLFDAYAREVARVDTNGDGVLGFVEVDLESSSDGGQSNERLYLSAPMFNRFAVTREINDGLLQPRFAPSQRAWLMAGPITVVNPSVPASTGLDADLR